MSHPDRPTRSKPTNILRRTFLGATLAAPALAVASSATRDAPPSAPESGATRALGYHMTEHIRTYYRLARF